jgi:hypothetical protein
MKFQFPLCQGCPEGELDFKVLGSRVRGTRYEVDLQCRRCGRFWIVEVRAPTEDEFSQNERGFDMSAHDWRIVSTRPAASEAVRRFPPGETDPSG